MHMNKVLITTLLVVLVAWISSAAPATSHRWRRSGPWSKLSFRKRKLAVNGRSMDNSNPAESRGFMKMMMKGMFRQPQRNIIIITQTTTTTTAAPAPAIARLPAFLPTTSAGSSTTTAANSPTTVVGGRDDLMGLQMRNRNHFNPLRNLSPGQTEDIIQNILAGNQRMSRIPVRGGFPRRRLNQRQQNKHNRIEQIINNMSKRPGMVDMLSSGEGDIKGSGFSNDDNIGSLATPEGVNFNANARIQNIMNALRQPQTSVVYNK